MTALLHPTRQDLETFGYRALLADYCAMRDTLAEILAQMTAVQEQQNQRLTALEELYIFHSYPERPEGTP